MKTRPESTGIVREIELSSLDLRYQSYRLKEAAAEGRLLASIAQRGIEDPALTADALGAQWQLLQGVRLLRSGSKPAQVVAKLGYRDEQALAQACQHWLGLTLEAVASAQ